ncbi:MAG TPA: OmpA family protein, partial [bacterium]|nr:OmpA family protein [bacterium]
TELINREYNAIKIKLEELTKLVGLDKIEELKKLENENAAIIEELEKLKLNVLNLTHQEKEIKIIIYEKDLYQPNKMLLNNGGIEILKKLSEIFNKYTSRKILISGHSDNIATNNPKYPTNWELSSARASVIARTLINNFKVSANRITVQGLADTKPIASNSTADGRSKNRRIEIIISSY